MYLTDIETKFNQEERNVDYLQVQEKGTLSVFVQKARPFGDKIISTLSSKDMDLAHWYILHNCIELEKYFR